MGQENDSRSIVMVVDDSDDLRLMLATYLREAGYEVIEAKNGLEAVEVAREKCPALVFMDINMPVMDGLTATRLLREIKELCGTAVVALSAFGSEDYRQLALDAGCNAYVNKMASLNHLLRLAQDFLPAA